MTKKPTYEELEERVNELEQQLAECRRAEQALLDSERTYRYLAENVDVGMTMIDPDHNILWTNRTVGEWFDKDPSEFVAMKCYKAFQKREQVCADCPGVRAMATGRPHEIESQGVRDDGTTFTVRDRAFPLYDKEGKIIGFHEIVEDVSDRKQAEEALRESEERYRHLLDNITFGVALIDSGHNIVMANPSYSKQFNKPISELVGKKCFQEFEKRDAICPHCPGVQAMATGEPAEVETRGVRDDGSSFDVGMRAFPTFRKDGTVTGFIEIVDDITEQKRLRGELQRAQKLEAVATLAGGIAHDFNNLLTSIQGNVSLMLLNIDSTHPHYERLKNVEKQVQSGARLTSHLLGYARKGNYEIKTVDLNQLVEETAETFGRARKQIQIHRDLAGDLSAVEADPWQIEQVLFNLLVNAADAMSIGGDLFLKTMNVTHKDMAGKIYKPKPGDYVMLTVTDSGMGMDKETMERIFDPFFTTKELGRGTGLGLASAYGIIKGHGGHIDVESHKGQGTTFSIFLPASKKKVERVVQSVERLTKGIGTVLLVDDEGAVLETGKDLLEAMGYRVLTADRGTKAIELYRKNQDEIVIVVLDMVMPAMGGGEAYGRLKEINPGVKVLLSSGYSIDGEATEILKRGCNGFIQKPFTMNELAEKVRGVLNKK